MAESISLQSKKGAIPKVLDVVKRPRGRPKGKTNSPLLDLAETQELVTTSDGESLVVPGLFDSVDEGNTDAGTRSGRRGLSPTGSVESSITDLGDMFADIDAVNMPPPKLIPSCNQGLTFETAEVDANIASGGLNLTSFPGSCGNQLAKPTSSLGKTKLAKLPRIQVNNGAARAVPPKPTSYPHSLDGHKPIREINLGVPPARRVHPEIIEDCRLPSSSSTRYNLSHRRGYPDDISGLPVMPIGRVVTPLTEDCRIIEPDSRHQAMILRTLLNCNLLFSGKPGEDVEEFLYRVDQAQLIIGASDRELLQALSFCLRGPALTWFMTHSDELLTWENLKESFRTCFSDLDYQRALREEIDKRTQGAQELVRSYISCMRGLFQRTSPPWPESERVIYTIRNLLPHFQKMIPPGTFTTMQAVEEEAVRIEKIDQNAQTRRQPPRPELSLCPGFACPTSRSINFAPNRPAHPNNLRILNEEGELFDHQVEPDYVDEFEALKIGREILRNKRREQNKQISSTVDQATQITSPLTSTATQADGVINPPRAGYFANQRSTLSVVNTVECWNCESFGHVHRDCPEPRRRFCFRCRRSGVTTATCPFCNSGTAN